MPGLNQKGPMGDGPMSGRRMGRCTSSGAKNQNANSVNNENTIENILARNFGRGFGRGQGGMGMGRRNRFRNGQ